MNPLVAPPPPIVPVEVGVPPEVVVKVDTLVPVGTK